ncbi:hypothetical protein JT359_13045 [Candidatus Poribacteria bacterium]|nr:hypothetical protein [Candidatus Poribacteria bacterium]
MYRVFFIGILIVILAVGFFIIQNEVVQIKQLKNDKEESSLLRRQYMDARRTKKVMKDRKVESNQVDVNLVRSKPSSASQNGILPSDKLPINEKQDIPSANKNIQSNEPLSFSPHGFGAYPSVPNDFRSALGNPIWEHPKFPDGISLAKGAELLHRVLIKSWKEGNRTMIGASGGSNGKVWITYPNTIYVWYGDPIEDENGKIRIPIRRTSGDPDIKLSNEEMRDGIVPSGIRVLDGDTDAIDIDKFLNLNAK